jgi:two-component system, chemotaxis family, CheB/CheR fusion protein
MAQGGETEAVNQLARHVRLREAAFNSAPVAQMVVDLGGTVVLLNDHMRSLFGLDSRDLGRPLQDLEISYRPLELRSLMDQARAERRAVTAANAARHRGSGEPQFFEVTVLPLLHNGDNPLGVGIIFSEVTRYLQLQADLQRSNQELETAHEELQSAHEELETTNEELETINTELRDRSAALDSANLFLHAILTRLRTGVVVVDRQLKVLIWNYRAEDLWGLRADEVQGKSLLSLDIGLSVRQLEGSIRLLLHGESKHEETVLDALNRRGRSIRCRITCTPLGSDRDGGVPGVVLLMTDLEPAAAPAPSGDGDTGS